MTSTGVETRVGKKLNAQWLRKRLDGADARRNSTINVGHDADGRYQPFPMTDMQQAYWLGRSNDLVGGGTMQMYHEFDGDALDIERLETAWNLLIERHDMLRAVVTEDGLQCVLKNVPYQKIERLDLSGLGTADREAALLELRESILAESPPLDAWPQSRLVYVTLGESGLDVGRLFMRLDMWCFDGRSFQIIIEDLASLYHAPDCDLPETAVQFRDYVKALQEHEEGSEFNASLQWWRDRLKTMPGPPSLPYKSRPEAGKRPKFRRLAASLSPEETESLKRFARQHDVGLPGVMATAYAQVLSLWSSETHFTLNVPRFNRPDWHPDLNEIIGEFASFSLLEINIDPKTSFRTCARAVQQQLWTDLSHGAVSGVRKLRELAHIRGGMETGAMPIVFTTMPERRSADADKLERAMNTFGKLGFSLSGTPQVWVDSHYFELDGTMHFNWDTVEGLFEDGVAEAMFESYSQLVKDLANIPDRWTEMSSVDLPRTQTTVRASINDRPWVTKADPMALIAAHAADSPDHFAIQDGNRVISRGELSRSAGAIARHLQNQGVGRGDIVGLYAARGWQQVAAVLGILSTGAAYMPLDTASPEARLVGLLANAQPAALLTDDPTAINDPPCAILELSGILNNAQNNDSLDPVGYASHSPAAIIHTSGSTGVPKGVVIPWSALTHVILYSNERFALTPDDRALMVTSFHHDLSLYDLLGPLSAGGGLVTLDPDRNLDPIHCIERAATGRVTFWNSVPQLAAAFVEALEQAPDIVKPPMRQFVLGGDWVPPELPGRLHTQWEGLGVTTIGGPTETTIWNIMNDVPANYETEARLPYGRPIPGCSYRILDAAGRDCPDWVPGEMACGGTSVTTAYLNNPEETAKRFIYAADTGERLYLTGDRGRFRPDGMIEILGRVDSQLNVGGYRADPAGIESVVEQLSQVESAVVIARMIDESETLCGFIIPEKGAHCDEATLSKHCAAHLPAALVPKMWIALESFPLSGNGKIDRKALQSMDILVAANECEAAATPLEKLLAQLWSEVLNVPIDSVNSNFFGTGGDSIGATQIISRLDKAIGVRLPIGAFFAAPTIRALAREVLSEIATDAEPPSEIDGLPLEELRRKTNGSGKATEIAFQIPSNDAMELSWAQERLWFMDRLAPQNALYNLIFGFEIEGPLRPECLEAALADVIARHETLRTVYPDDSSGKPGIRILETVDTPFTIVDIAELTRTEQEPRLTEIRYREAVGRFDLSVQPPLRAVLVRISENRYQFFCTFHHIAFDGWSISVFCKDLFTAYESHIGAQKPEPKPISSYAGFSKWQRARLTRDRAANEKTWWRDRLEGYSPLSPQGDFAATTQRSFKAACHEFSLPAPIKHAVETLAKRLNATPNIVLLAAFTAAFGRYESQSRFVVGVASSGRDHVATEDMVGFFVKNLPLRVSLDKDTSFERYTEQIRDEFLEGMNHLDLPFQQIVSALSADRDPGHNPLFRVAFTYQNAPLEKVQTSDLMLGEAPTGAYATHLDFDLFLWPTESGIRCQAVYATDIFAPRTVTGICDAFECLLTAALRAPATPVDVIPLIVSHNDSRLDGGRDLVAEGESLWQRVAATLAATDAILLNPEGETLATGPDLLARAADLDAHLSDHGVEDGTAVAIHLDPSVEYVVSILACLRRGSPYLLMDPMLPRKAVSSRLGAIGVRALIAPRDDTPAPGDAESLIVIDPTAPAVLNRPPARPASSDAAPVVMVWTSGSTGSPKVPVLTQRALLNRLHWDAHRFPQEEKPLCLLKTSPAFGDSIVEVLLPLTEGHATVIADPAAIRTPSALTQLLHDTKPTRLVLTPSVAHALLESDERSERWPLKRLHLSGEPLPAGLFRRLRDKLDRDCTVVNIFGSSEVTADVTAMELDLSSQEPDPAIGEPLPGCTIWLLDENRNPVPAGAVGEMYIAGVCVAEGYYKAPVLTETAFISWTPPSGEEIRLFKTGDLARRRADGQLVHMGRKDSQIKIRGVRIEPGEIETCLTAHETVTTAVVRAHKSEHSEAPARLIAYAEPALDVKGREDAFREELTFYLRQQLPPTMVPSHIVLMRDWPMTFGGKIARSELPDPPDRQRRTSVPPATDAERKIAEIWAVYVGEAVGVTDSFFEAGGDSLQLAEVHRKLISEFGRSFPLVELFRHPTVRAQAGYVAGGSNVKNQAASAARQRALKRLKQ